MAGPPDNAPNTLNDIFSALGGGSNPADVVIEQVGLDQSTEPLSQIRFGNITAPAEFKAAEDPDAKSEGALSGLGVIVGTETAASGATILNNADYKTSRALEVSHWDDQTGLAEFTCVSNAMAAQASAIGEAALKIVEMLPALPFPVQSVTTPMRTLLQQLKSEIATVGASSQVHFKAFDGDPGLAAAEPEALPSGFSLQLVVMSPGLISFQADE